MTDARAAAVDLEVLTSGTPDARTAAVAVEALVAPSADARLAGTALAVLGTGVPDARVAGAALAVLAPAYVGYSAEVHKDSPLAYYRLGEPSGTAFSDSSGHGRTGTLSGTGTTLGVTGLIKGDSDAALTMAGTSVITRTSDAGIVTNSYSAEFVFKPGSVSINYQNLVNKCGTGSTTGWNVRLEYNRIVVFASRTTGYYAAQTPSMFVVGTTYHVVFTWDDASKVAKIYVNGADQTSFVVGGSGSTNPGTDALMIGQRGGESNFVGTIDEVAVYGSVLSSTRIAAHFDASGLNTIFPAAVAATSAVPGATAHVGYAADVLSDAPLAYYRLGEPSGTTLVDSSGNGHNGSYSGSPTLGAAGLLVGDSDTAVVFNGSQDASVGSASWMAVSAMTAEAIIKPSSIGSQKTIIGRFNYGPVYVNWMLYITPAGKLEFNCYLDGGSGNHYCTGTTTLVAGKTYHVAATYDGVTQYIYLNGVQDGTASATGTLNSLYSALRIASLNDASPSDYFAGTLDEVAFYGSALSSTRITAHFDASGLNVLSPAAVAAVSSVPAVSPSYDATVSPDAVTSTSAFPSLLFDSNVNAASITAVSAVPTIALVITANVPAIVVAATASIYGMSNYAGHVLADTPLAYYKLNELSGSTFEDSSGHNRTASLMGSGSTPGQAGALVAGGKSLQVNGSGGLAIPHAADLDFSYFTMEFFLYWTSRPSNYTYIFTHTDSSPAMRFHSTSMQTFLGTANGAVGPNDFTAMSSGAWHHVVVTWDGTNLITYYDGSQYQSIAGGTGAVNASTSGYVVGGPGWDGSGVVGYIDEVALYDKALSPARITAHYNASKDPWGIANILAAPIIAVGNVPVPPVTVYPVVIGAVATVRQADVCNIFPAAVQAVSGILLPSIPIQAVRVAASTSVPDGAQNAITITADNTEIRPLGLGIPAVATVPSVTVPVVPSVVAATAAVPAGGVSLGAVAVAVAVVGRAGVPVPPAIQSDTASILVSQPLAARGVFPAAAPSATALITPVAVQATASTPEIVDTIPPAAVTDFTVTAIDMYSAQLTWTAPTDPDFDYVLLMRTEGLPYAEPDEALDPRVTTYDGALSPHPDSGLIPGRTYYYSAYSFDTTGNASYVGATALFVTESIPSGDPLGIAVSMLAGSVSLLAGTPVEPVPSEDIVFYGVPITITLTEPAGVTWVNDLLQPPPAVPGETTGWPGNLIDPAILRTPTDIRAEVWNYLNTEKIANLDYSAARQFLDEYNGVGSGSLQVPAVHPDAALLRRDRVLRFYYKDIPDAVFASIIEGRKTNVVAEAGSNWAAVSGRGLLAWLEDAVVLPYVTTQDKQWLHANPTAQSVMPDGTRVLVESNIMPYAPDVRAFNFGSRDAFEHVMFNDVGPGSSGANQELLAPWSNLTAGDGVTYASRSDKVRGYPIGWPDPSAQWIWQTNPQGDVKDGLQVSFRGFFTLGAQTTVDIYGAADDTADFYIDGVQKLFSTPGYKTLGHARVTLSQGQHELQITGRNAYLPALALNPASVIATIRNSSSGTIIFRTNTTQWQYTRWINNFLVTEANYGPGWHRPLGITQSAKAPLNRKQYFPTDWPDPAAQWLWGSDPTHSAPGEQLCWFRAKVWIETSGTYRWFCTADDSYIMWIDGIEVLSLEYDGSAAGGWTRTDEVDVKLDQGFHVFAMRGRNATRPNPTDPRSNPAAVIGTLMTLDSNQKPKYPVAEARTYYTGSSPDVGWYANWAAPAWNAGDVLYTLVKEAQARGVTRLQNVTMDFNATTDSNGEEWTTRVSRTWDVGTSLLQVAFDLCELGVDIWMTPDNMLHCAERRGSDIPTFSVLYGRNISGYDVDETFTGASVAYTRTRTGWFTLESDNANIILGGKRETGISLANTDSEDVQVGISTRAIGAVVMANMVATAQSIIPVAGSIPYTDVGISDIIHVLSPDGSSRMGRLLSISLTENEAGASTWVPEIEIWNSPFGDGVDPNRPHDPVDPNNPYDPSTWVPSADDWTRFIPEGAGSDYPRAVTLAQASAWVDGAPSPSPSGAIPVPLNSAQAPRPLPNTYNNGTPPNAERVAVAPTPPLITAGYHLWVDTSGIV